MKTQRESNIQKIFRDVAKLYGVTITELKSRSRLRKYADARAVICYILCSQCKLSYSEVASMLNRTHATVIYFVKNAEGWLRVPAFNPKGANAINELINKNNYKQKWREINGVDIYGN